MNRIMKKINIKKIPLFITILLIFITITGLIVKDDLKSIYSNYQYKNSLSEQRQNAYDKMKIDYVNIKNRVTGTAPWNTGTTSNDEGIDVSEKDDYVRTLDTMKYTIELGVSPNTAADGVTEASTYKGGVIKVKAKLPNQGAPILMTWEQDAWMQNVSYNADKTEMYAEYHVPADVSVTNANQSLSFTVKVNGYKKDVTKEMAPEFEVWMEGNEPDNQTSKALSVTAKDTGRKIIISATPLINVSVQQASHLNLKGKGQVNGKTVTGQYINFGVGLSLNQTVSNISDLRGIEYPTGPFTIKLKLQYKYNDLSNLSGWQTLTADNPKAYDKINASKVIVYGINGEEKDGYYPVSNYTRTTNQFPYGSTKISKPIRSVQDSGTVNLVQNGDEITITFKDYVLNGTFPTHTMDVSEDIPNISSKVGYFAVANFEMFIPYYDDGGSSYDYQLSIEAVEATYNTLNKNNISMGLNTTNSVNDTDPSDNRRAALIKNYLSGSAWGVIRSYDEKPSATLDKPFYYGNGAIQKGNDFVIYTHFRLYDGPYKGGSDSLITWNTNFFRIKKYDSTKWYTTNTGSVTGIESPTLDNIKVFYGIYKKAPSTGITDNTTVNGAVYNDFNWYSSYDEASKYGVVSSVYINDKDNSGFTVTRYYYFRFEALDNPNNIGKAGIFRYRTKFYGDEARTQVFYYGGQERYNSNTGYIPTKYGAEGAVETNEASEEFGETILVIGLKSEITTTVTDKDSAGKTKTAYDVQDGEVHVKVSPTLKNGKAASDTDPLINSVIVKSTLPEGLSYVNGSANKTPSSVKKNADGSTTITWEYKNWQVNHAAPSYPNITYTAEISVALENNTSLNISSTIFTESDLRDEVNFRTGSYGIVVSNLSGSRSLKRIDKPVVDKNESFTIVSSVGNTSQEDLNNVKTLEILPVNGDANGSRFNGNYTIKIESVTPDQKIYYTTKNIVAIGITEDKYGKLTIKDVDLANDDRWIEVKKGGIIPSNATAMASVITNIAAKTSEEYSYTVIPQNNLQGNTYAFTMNVTSDNLAQAVKSNTVVAKVVTRNIEGFAFIDVNRNNIYDSGDKLLPNNVVRLLNSSGDIITTTQTDSNGKYIFKNVDKGTYYVEFAIPTNYELVTKNAGDKSVSSAVNSNKRTDQITTHNNSPTAELITVNNQNLGIRRIDAKLVVHHYIDGTTTKLAPDQTSTVYYGDTYTTSIHKDVPKNYELKSKSNNFTGTVSTKNIEVIYYYQKKDSSLETSISKEGPEETTAKEASLNYKITYTAKVVDYIGDGTITIVDTLPYHIDTDKSNLDGGIYDQESNTITWTIPWNGIDSYSNKGTTTIVKNISLVYSDLLPTERNMINSVKGSISLDNNSRVTEDQSSTDIKIPGNIVVHHYLKDTKVELVPNQEFTDLVGEHLTTNAQELEGYIIHKPETEEYIFTEEPQEVIYEYEKIKVKVTTIVDGIGGTIRGDEDVEYGDDSTKDKIVIIPDEGYVLGEVIINGQKVEITEEEKRRLILNNFPEMKKDIIIQVKFIKEVEVLPATGAFANFVIILIPILIMLFVFLKFKKTKIVKLN